MHDHNSLHRKAWKDRRIYPTYEPYPVSLDFENQSYAGGNDPEEKPVINNHGHDLEEPFFTDSEPSGGFFPQQTPLFDEESSIRPLKLLNSLFSDRLDFLNRALEELEKAHDEREKMTRNGLEELDSGIKECEHSLSLTLINHPEQKRHLERKLMELKNERRREKLLSWRDLIWLKGEIRKLQRQIDSLKGTAKSAENREAPT